MNTGTVETVTGDSDSGAVRVARGLGCPGPEWFVIDFYWGHGTCQHCQHGIDQFWQTVTERGKNEEREEFLI